MMAKRVGWISATVLWVTLCAMAAAKVAGQDVGSMFDPMLSETAAEHWLPTKDARQVPGGGYYLAYDGRARTARYVLELLTRTSLRKKVTRAAGFRADEDAPAEARATPASYERSGYDQGHLAPAADWMGSDKQQAATFILSNAAPQMPSINRGVWKALESHVRTVAEESNGAVVITAPLYMPDPGEKSFTIEVIGKDRVWVPSHFGKAMLCQDGVGRWSMSAWIVPNVAVEDPDYHCYSVTMDEFESALGIDLWAALPDGIEKELEKRPKLVPVPE